MSIPFYDANAEAYFAETAQTDLAPARARFLAHVDAGGWILDAGCGSGRDALAFARAGYRVTAFDGSSAMARLASQHCGFEVRHMTFGDVRWIAEFDGVWACASLLHVPRGELAGVVARLGAALKPHGALYASFKLGDLDREVGGRSFTDMEPEALKQLFAVCGLEPVDLWLSGDARPKREHETWLNAVGQRTGP